MNAEDQLQTIREQVKVCKDCPLHLSRKNAVPGEGPADSAIMFIGEGPGYHENEQGKPFVGQAGKFLDELLAAGGLARKNVYITNVIKCRPPGNRDPEPTELAACRRYLDQQIRLINPKVIVTLGRFSMATFVENGRISQIHGKTHAVNGKTVVTMYHPAAALHQPALKGTLLKDFSHLRDLLNPANAIPKEAAVKEQKEPESNSPEQLSLF
ncbi:MAG: uracil-DNA glycosylase family protein [Anaerolineaceae bacterium]|jgi:uracil-DNA glycosylase family 4